MPESGQGRGTAVSGDILIVLGVLMLSASLFRVGGIPMAAIQPEPSPERSHSVVGRAVVPLPSPIATIPSIPHPSPFPSPTARARGIATATPFAQVLALSDPPAIVEGTEPLLTLPPSSPTATPGSFSPGARVAMPRLGIDVAVVEMDWRVLTEGGVRRVEWEVPEKAAGHATNSASPGGVGNVVITGHHNIKGEVFRGLWNAREGDEIILYGQEGALYRYVVVQDALILPEKDATVEERQAHARYMDQTSDSRVTLITCWPYHDNTHRVIVIGLLES